MKSIEGFFGTAGLVAALTLSGAAPAAPIQSIGVGGSGSFVLYFDSPSPNLSAFANVDIYSATSTQLVLRFAITNDTIVSEAGPVSQAALMSIGLDFDPNPTGASLSVSGAIFDGLTTSVDTFPNGFTIDVCAFAANNCQGGDIKDGLLVQDLVGTDNDIASPAGDTFRLALTRSASTAAWNLNTAAVKFQTNMGSYEFAGCTTENQCARPPTRIPEPGSLALVGCVGLASALTAWRRRRTS